MMARSGTERRLGVYVHFPWCLKKCPYCDFVSYAKKREEIDHVAYADALVRELEARAPALADHVATTLFFGGGTPSLFEPGELGRVVREVELTLARGEELEVTMECNPTSLDEERAAHFREAGVTRFSIGTQSLDADELKYLGRLHDGPLAERAIRAALKTGARVSSDLIFGLPNQPIERPVEQALALVDLGLRHLSCYQLTIEPGTQFGELARLRRLPLAEDGRVAESFLAIDEALEARGLRHYEISNYASPGHESRHNLGYWRGVEYLGLGTAAVGRIGATRYKNEPDPKRYEERTRTMGRACFGESDGLSVFEESLDGETLLRERIMLGLRLEEGLDLEAAGRDLGIDPFTDERKRTLDRLKSNGRIWRRGSSVGMSKEAWLFANDTAARLF